MPRIPTVVDVLPVHDVVPGQNVPAEANWAKSKLKRGSLWPWVLGLLVLSRLKRRRRR